MSFNKYISIAVLGLVLASCSFLDENIRSSSQKDKYYKTEDQILSGLGGCYMPLRNIYDNSSYFVITECQTDLIYESGTGVNATFEGLGPTNPSTATSLWTNGYLGVMRCNAIIAAIERSALTLQQIASRMSFADQSSFGKFFKKHTGVSPMRYRMTLRKTLLTLRPGEFKFTQDSSRNE